MVPEQCIAYPKLTKNIAMKYMKDRGTTPPFNQQLIDI